MMRVGIITFHDVENYGAALQAFALKQASNRYSSADIINYYNDYFHRNISGTGVKAVLKKIMNYSSNKRKSIRFRNFQTKYLAGESQPIKQSDLQFLNDEYDLFITGSDQVWNLECSGNDTSYFLDFVKCNKKNSYAASFGISKVNDEKKICELLDNYSKISVREESGRQIIQQLLGKEVPVVLDPTFLLDKGEWGRLFNLEFEEKYVLVYEVLTGDKLFEQAKAFAKKKGMKVVCITSTDKLRSGATLIKSAGPLEWLNLFAGAAYVFTNSFHGLAFSLNFEKQFFVELLPPPANTNARISDLLEKVKLIDRRSADANELGDISYDKIGSIMESERLYSIRYLQSIFNEG